MGNKRKLDRNFKFRVKHLCPMCKKGNLKYYKYLKVRNKITKDSKEYHNIYFCNTCGCTFTYEGKEESDGQHTE